jgi:hypothetical protein
MGLDLFICDICNNPYTEYEQYYCKCGNTICEYCVEDNKLEELDNGYIKECPDCDGTKPKESEITISLRRYDELLNIEEAYEKLIDEQYFDDLIVSELDERYPFFDSIE